MCKRAEEGRCLCCESILARYHQALDLALSLLVHVAGDVQTEGSTGLRRKEGRERVFHVDDATSNIDVRAL